VIGLACLLWAQGENHFCRSSRRPADIAGNSVPAAQTTGGGPTPPSEAAGDIHGLGLLQHGLRGHLDRRWGSSWAHHLFLYHRFGDLYHRSGAGHMVFGYWADRTKSDVLKSLLSPRPRRVLILIVSQFLGNSQFFFAKLIFTFKNNSASLIS